VSDLVGASFLPEFPLPAALSIAFSPLLNTNVLSEWVDECDETWKGEMNVIRLYRHPAMQVVLCDLERRVSRAGRGAVCGDWMLLGRSDRLRRVERASSFVKVSLAVATNLLHLPLTSVSC
jgi:hypothetical protein